jgi:hypothetical protein
VGAIVPLGVGLALIPLRPGLGTANVALILVLLVVGAAATGRRSVALVTATSGALVFDVMHTEPFGSLAIANRQEIITFVCVLALGIAVAEVATWGRRQRTTAERTISDVSILRSVAELIATGEDPEYVVMAAAFWLRELLDLADCRLERGPSRVGRAGLSPDGEITLGPVRWDAENGMPATEIELAVRGGGHAVARFVLTPKAGTPVDADRLLTAAAVADQVGSCLAGADPSAAP